MKKKKKNFRKKPSRSKRRKFKKIKKKLKRNKRASKSKLNQKRKIVTRKRKKTSSNKRQKIRLAVKNKKKTQKTRAVISGILNLSDKLKSVLRFNFNLDRSLQIFFQGISDRVSSIKKVIQEEREKQRKIKIQEMKREKIEAQNRFKQKEELALKSKALELKEEEKLGRERKIELQKFIRLEQAELRKERAEKQRKFL